MSDYKTNYTINHPQSEVAVLCDQAFSELGWNLTRQSDAYFVLKESRGFATAFTTNSYPVTINIELESESPGTTKIFVEGSNFGLGPFQMRHVKKQVASVLDTLSMINQKLDRLQMKPRNETPLAKTDASVTPSGNQVLWETREFICALPGQQGAWVKVGTMGYSDANTKIEFWQNYQQQVYAELQPWLDDGWQPVGQVGSACIELTHSNGFRDKSCAWFVMVTLAGIPTFGIGSLFILLFSWGKFAHASRFVLKIRRSLKIQENDKLPNEKQVTR